MVFLLTATGWEKFTCCQPEADSPVKVALASSWPVEVHKLPIWVPVFVPAL